MARTFSRRTVVDLEARRETYGEIYVWLYKRHGRMIDSLRAKTPALWEFTARAMIRDGVQSKHGEPPTRQAARKAWLRVAQHFAEDARLRAEAASARSGHVSRRTKAGWVPPSSAPAQPSPVPAISRRDTTPAPRLLPATSPAPASSAPPSQAAATPTHRSSSPHLLGDITPEEAKHLAQFGDLPENAKQSLLRTLQSMAHMDRFNRPFKK